MAFAPLRSKALHHGRSLSLPSESHSAMSQFDENLSRVRTSRATCSSFSSMNGKINGLRNLYDSLEDSFLLPHNQQMFSQDSQEQILDYYIRLLDACSTVRDLISVTKQDVRELLSALRRKDAHGIQVCLTSRRKSKRMIQKSLKTYRSFGSKGNAASFNKEMLKDIESVTLSVFESLLSYVMGTKVQERKSGWSLVSKLMHSKKVSGEESYLNEFKRLDLFLQLSQENGVEELVNHLNEMDSSIQIIEEELELLFRQLIKTRVSLLNILNH